MDGDDIAARWSAATQRVGDTYTLRRPGTTDIDVTVKASRIGASSIGAVQGQTTSSFRVRISNAEIAAQAAYTLPIQVGLDQLIDSDGRAYVIKAADTKRPGGVVVGHVLTVEG